MTTEQHWLKTALKCLAIGSLCIASMHSASAQTSQPDAEMIMEAMRNAGLDPNQLEQMGGLIDKIAEQEAQKKEARRPMANLEFEEGTEGLGTVDMTIGDERSTLWITRCNAVDHSSGIFSIEAMRSSNRDEGRLIINASGQYAHGVLRYTDANRQIEANKPVFAFDGQTLEWAGPVEGPGGKADFTVRLNCRAEAGVAKPAVTFPSGGVNVSQPADRQQENPLVAMMQYRPGNPTVHIRGWEQQGAGSQTIEGDCDGAMPDDDLEVMTFAASWKQVGAGGSSSLVGGHNLTFEKKRGIPPKRLSLSFQPEVRRVDLASRVHDYPVVANIPFAGDTVKLFFVNLTADFSFGYHALFPIAQLEGFPMNMQESGRYLAHVHFGAVGPLNFDGWPQDEVVNLFKSLHTSRCLGDGLGREFVTFSPAIIYE